jgi:hypothetical protein
MSKVSREERGWAGHLCVADGCRFRRNTLLWSGETYVVVSTVGNYCYQGKPDEIGCNRYYETMVFFSKDDDALYHDADVIKEISFNSPWAIDHISEQSDKEANYMHDMVVLEIMQKMESGELVKPEGECAAGLRNGG